MTTDIKPAEDLASDETILQEVLFRLKREHIARSQTSGGEVAASGMLGDLASAIKLKSATLCTDIYGDVSGRLATFTDDLRQLLIDALTHAALKPSAQASQVSALSGTNDNRLAASFLKRLRQPADPNAPRRERPLLKSIQQLFLDFIGEYGPQLAATFGPQLLQLIQGLFAVGTSALEAVATPAGSNPAPASSPEGSPPAGEKPAGKPEDSKPEDSKPKK